jgi:Ca2+-binding RTX toxin-like protein
MDMRRLLVVASALTLAVLFAPLPAPAQEAAPTCVGRPATIVGTNGNDYIRGTNFPDVIASLGGNDNVHALAGGDLVCGAAGADIIFDGHGLDAIDGGTGVDTVYLCPDSVFDRLVSVEKIINSYLGCS